MAGRQGMGRFLRNWRASDAWVGAKLREAVANNARKLRTRSSCCGNHGAVGC